MDGSSNSDTSGLAWYCARTQPKHEHIAARNLKSRLDLKVFHPRLKIERTTRRGIVRLVEPLFPGYLFVRCVLALDAEPIRHTFGVSSFVHFGNAVPVVPDSVISDLQQCFDDEEAVTAQDPLRIGTEVTIAEGSFLGSGGIVVRLMPAKQRVQILLEVLGRTTLTEVDRRSLVLDRTSFAEIMPGLAVAAA